MAKPKKPRKKRIKYTLAQTERHIANQAIKDIICVYIYAGKGTRTKHFNIKTMQQVETTPLIDSALKFYPHKWVVSVSLLMRERNGKLKAPGEILSVNEEGKAIPVMFYDLEATLSVWHTNLAKTTSAPECVLTPAWIGNPHGYEITPEKELEIYELMGGFHDFIAQWEYETTTKEVIHVS